MTTKVLLNFTEEEYKELKLRVRMSSYKTITAYVQAVLVHHLNEPLRAKKRRED